MGEAEDVLTICTSLGYAKVICAADTTVKELIGMAMRTVSLMSSSQLYGLQTPRDDHNLNSFRHILCRDLTWAEIKKLYHPTELTLAICLYPTKFEEAARNDRSTLFYLHQQAKEIYHAHFKDITDVAMAFEIGCLDIRSFASTSDPCTKDLLDVLDKGRGLNSFFPPCVLQAYKSKALRRAVQHYLVKVQHYSEEDCALDMLNRYLILLKFDRDVVRCSFGAGHGFPVELVIGPRFQVSIMLENAAEPRTVAYFASIKKVMVSKTVSSDGVRYQVRLAIEQSSDPNAPLEIMTFSFQSQEAADTVVHLLEGYCGEAIGAAVHDNGCDMGTASELRSHRGTRENFLPNGCPYRLKETNNSEIQKLEMSRDSVLLEQVLGEGQFGDVYKGIYRKDSHAETMSVAVKTCKIDASPEERGQFLEEARILSEFNHPHIIRLFGVCSEEPIWLVMEYAPLGELRHYLLARNGQIALPLLLTFCYQIVTALTCLEAKRCVHRDIAARNILVARSDWVKLADFGMARMLYDANEFRADKGRKMPIKWMAPESVHHRRFSSASDVWMFGVCMWEILSGGTKPFADMTNAEAAEHVTRGQRLKRPELCPRNLYVVMLECWNTNPQRRPTFAALKPRLRELAAQSREAAKSDYQNSENNALLANPEANDLIPDNLPVNSNHCSSGKVSPTRKPRTNHHHSSGNRKQYAQHTSQHGNSSTAKLPSLHSHWEEVTELEPTGEDSDNGSSRYETSHDFTEDNGQKNKIQCSVNMNDTRTGAVRSTTGSSRSKSLGNTHHQCHSNRRTSPERSRTQTTHLETNVPNYTGVTASGHNRLHSAPNINRDTSPKRKVTGGYDSSEPSSPRSKERVTRQSSNRRRSFEDGIDNQLASDHSRTQNNNGGAHCSETGFRNTTSHTLTEKQPEPIVYDEEFPETNNDRVYLSTVQVVKTVRLASQQLAVAPVEKYPLLVKSIGASVRDLFTSIEAEFGANNIDNEIFLAERQLNASMYQLISTIKDAKLSINRGPLLEEYRRHLLTLCYAIAADAHSLYTSVYEFRNRPVSSRISPS